MRDVVLGQVAYATLSRFHGNMKNVEENVAANVGLAPNLTYLGLSQRCSAHHSVYHEILSTPSSVLLQTVSIPLVLTFINSRVSTQLGGVAKE